MKPLIPKTSQKRRNAMYRSKIIVSVLLQFVLCALSDISFAHKPEGDGAASDSRSHKEGKEADEWNPVSAGPLTTWTAPLCDKGKLVVQPFLFYNRSRGTF